MAVIARQTHLRLLRSFVSCTAALVLLAGSSAAFTFTTIDVPGASYTEARGINRQGQIVGFYGSAEGTGFQGFRLDQGAFTTINFPGAVDTALTDITGNGNILGYYTTVRTHGVPLNRRVFTWTWPHLPRGVVRANGFLLRRSLFTPIDVPDATDTVPSDIGRHGQIVGLYVDSNGIFHGFLLQGGVFTTIDVPGATATQASGINGRGQVVGSYQDPSGVVHGFLLSEGVFTTIDVPGALHTLPNSINGRGQIVGFYHSPRAHGFLLDQGVFTTIDVPGAANTFIRKIKGHRIVGSYVDTNGFTHGFLTTP